MQPGTRGASRPICACHWLALTSGPQRPVLWSIIRSRAQTIRVSLKAKRFRNHVFTAFSTIKASTPSSQYLPTSITSWVHGPRLERLDFLEYQLVAVLDEGVLTHTTRTTLHQQPWVSSTGALAMPPPRQQPQLPTAITVPPATTTSPTPWRPVPLLASG